MVRVCVARVRGFLEEEKPGDSSISVKFCIMSEKATPLSSPPWSSAASGTIEDQKSLENSSCNIMRGGVGRRPERICACIFVSLQRLSGKDARVCDMIGCRCSLATPGYKTPAPWRRESVRIRSRESDARRNSVRHAASFHC